MGENLVLRKMWLLGLETSINLKPEPDTLTHAFNPANWSQKCKPGIVAHICKLSRQEAEAGGLIKYSVGQPQLSSKMHLMKVIMRLGGMVINDGSSQVLVAMQAFCLPLRFLPSSIAYAYLRIIKTGISCTCETDIWQDFPGSSRKRQIAEGLESSQPSWLIVRPLLRSGDQTTL